MAQYWPQYTYYRANDLSRKNVYARLSGMRKALSELRLHCDKRDIDIMMQKEELRVDQLVSDDTNEETESDLSVLREKVKDQESEMSKLQRENQEMKATLATYELHMSKVNGLVMLHGTKEDGEFSTDLSQHLKPCNSEEKKEENGLFTELERRLAEAEERGRCSQERADHMTLLLNQKLIELNKLQLTLSNQTKDMIQLEKAYFQLRCHLGKTFRSPASSSSRSTRLDLLSS